MTNQSPFGGRMARTYPTLPSGETVASFETYAEAQAGVDTLAKAGFPVKELAIVGTGLTSVERITGTLSWGRAAGAGALSGAWFGTFLGLLFFIFAPTGASLGILGAAILIGAGFGMIFSVVSYSVNRRRRDFTSIAQVLATRYSIVAEPAHVTRARQVLGTTDVAGAPWSAPAAPVPPAASAAVPAAAPPPAPAASAEPSGGEAASAGGEGTEASDTGAEAAEEEPRGLTYGEAQDAARRARRQRERGDADA
ncbi:general stress protein [Agromyces sp. H66]|uniref:general stress protein n=1 Tax=Agromyces sp. H66 TaxID=2529859 RepID=UPI001B7D9019|nr:general stress protein [Agromyces sp. H66]